MATKMATACSLFFHLWTLSVIHHQVASKFRFMKVPTWVLSYNQDGRQNGRHLSFALVDTCLFALVDILTSLFITHFLPNFIYELLLPNSRPNLNMGFVR